MTNMGLLILWGLGGSIVFGVSGDALAHWRRIHELRRLSGIIRDLTAHDLAVLQRLADIEERINHEGKL